MPLLTPFHQAIHFEALLREFPSLTSPQFIPARVCHRDQHSIVTTGLSFFVRPHCMPLERLQAACRGFKHMLEEGIVQPFDNNWASPLHMVPKAQKEEWRAYGD